MQQDPDATRTIRLFYGFQFFFSLLLWTPVFYEYQRRMGLSDPEVFSIQSIYYLAFLFLEIPTGLLADRWSKLGCLKLGAVILAFSNLLPVFAPTYGGFLWHFVLVALARSLISGAGSAYLYDYLDGRGLARLYKRAEGRARAYSLAGKVLFWAGIGVLMEWKLSLPYTLTAIAAAVSLGFAFFLPRALDGGSRPGETESRLTTNLLPVFKVLKARPVLILIILQGISIFVLSRVCQVNLFQPLLTERYLGPASFGWIMSVITLFEAMGSAYPGQFQKGLGRLGKRISVRLESDFNSIFVLTGVIAISMSLIAFSGAVGAVFWLSVLSWATGLAFPIQRQLMNDAIPDTRFRATLLSLESIFDRAVTAWVVSLLGTVVATGRIGTFLHLSAVFSLLGMAGLAIAFISMQRTREGTINPSGIAARR